MDEHDLDDFGDDLEPTDDGWGHEIGRYLPQFDTREEDRGER